MTARTPSGEPGSPQPPGNATDLAGNDGAACSSRPWLERRALRWARALWGGRWWWGSVRVVLFFSSLNLLVLGLGLPSAKAAAESTARRAGQALLREFGPSIIGDSQGVLINGQRIFIAAKTTALPAREVLAGFERHCRDGVSEWRAELDSLSSVTKALPENLRDISNATTFRMDPDGGSPGEVACIVPNESLGGIRGLLHRLAEFGSTGDLSKIGDGRFAAVRQDPETGRTLVVAAWTEGTFSLLSMFPEHGDAPGRDSPYAPRPRDSVRLLCAEMEGRPYAMRMYESERPRADVLDTYSREMATRGFQEQRMPSAPAFDMNGNARAFEKDGTAVIVTARDEASDKTGISILEMGSTGFVRATEDGTR